jgi:hypothetical protein
VPRPVHGEGDYLGHGALVLCHEPCQRVPVEVHPVARAGRGERHTLLKSERVLDVAIKAKAVRFQIGTGWDRLRAGAR